MILTFLRRITSTHMYIASARCSACMQPYMIIFKISRPSRSMVLGLSIFIFFYYLMMIEQQMHLYSSTVVVTIHSTQYRRMKINLAGSILPLLGPISSSLRSLLVNSLTDSGVFQTSSIVDIGVEVLSINVPGHPDKELKDSHIVVYLHGGAFVLRDCGDILIGQRLLPLLNRKAEAGLSSSAHIVLASVLYPLASAADQSVDQDQYEATVDFVVRAMQELALKAKIIVRRVIISY